MATVNAAKIAQALNLTERRVHQLDQGLPRERAANLTRLSA